MTLLPDIVAGLVALAPFAVIPAAAIMTRLSLVVFMMPAWGMRIVPVRVRLVMVLVLTFLLYPLLAPQVPTGVPLVVLLFGEAFAGFALGFLTRLTLFILSMVGAIVAQSLSLSQIFGAGISEDSNTTISTVLTIAGATLFVTTGLHVLTIELFVETYRLFPAGTVFADNATGRVAEHLIEVSGGAIAFSVSLALPFLLMNLAYNVLLGVLNRAMPQLMVTFVGMPAITLTGLVLLTIGIGGVLTLWLDIAGDLLLGMSP